MVRTFNVQPYPQEDDHPQTFSLGESNKGFAEREEIRECSCSLQQDGEGETHVNTTWVRKLKVVRNRYKSSFTMHAVTHIIEGTGPEKCIWMIKLFGAIGVAIYLCRNLFVAYFNYDVDTKLRVVVKTSLQFPTILLCAKDFRIMDSYHDCSSNTSKSYDSDICARLGRRCPPFYPDDDRVRAKDNTRYTPDTCVPELLGQCIVLNANGTIAATLTKKRMFYRQQIDASMLPLKWFINPPGVPLLPEWGKSNVDIDRVGYYHFTLEKMTYIRKPAPYSKPHCVEQGSYEAISHSMFTGPYTVSGCEETCFLEQHIKCGGIRNSQRVLVKDRDHFKNLLDVNVSHIEQCSRNNDSIWDEIEECRTKCFLPCIEEHYEVHDFVFLPSDHGRSEIELQFQFNELRETYIVEEPSFDTITLIANFGGTLGLMTGMSAMSIMELLYWFILFLVDRIHLLYKNLMTRSERVRNKDSVV